MDAYTENLEIDPEVLDTIAVIVEGYCSSQEGIMDDYLSRTSSLVSEWTDDQTFGSMLGEINSLRRSVVDLMDEIRTTYPKYFRAKAERIRNRASDLPKP